VLVVNTGPLDLTRFSGKRLHQSTPAQALQDIDGFLRSASELASELYVASDVAQPLRLPLTQRLAWWP
jgi:PTS system fructose-specific IIC component